MQGPPSPATSPWIQEFGDYVGNVIRITITFDEITRLILSGEVYRVAECLFTKILLGVGPDGTPDSTPYQFNVPAGTTVIPGLIFVAVGLPTIEDVQGLQITAGRP